MPETELDVTPPNAVFSDDFDAQSMVGQSMELRVGPGWSETAPIVGARVRDGRLFVRLKVSARLSELLGVDALSFTSGFPRPIGMADRGRPM